MNNTAFAPSQPAETGSEWRTASNNRKPRRRTAALKRGFAVLLQRAKRPPSGTRIDLAFIVLCAVVYGVLFFGLGDEFLPGHAAWATLLLWASALIGSLVADLIHIPNVIGMLAAGIMLRNIPWNAIDAFPKSWGTQMRAAALATIFLRCGLELDFGTMKRFKGPATRLAIIPGLAEAFFDGGLATVIFGMPILLGFTFGFIIKAVGPGLVVPAMFTLQKRGLGKDQGIPSTLVIAASFDDIIAIIGYSIFVNIAIQGGGNAAWQIAAGPLQVVFGICGGLIAGVALGCTKIFDTKVKRLVGIYGSCLLLMFFLGFWDMKAGGAIAALTVGLIASNAWEKGFPAFASLGPSYEFSPAIERYMHLFWVWIMEPIMFVTIGASIDIETLDTGTIPKALIIIFSGLGLRMIVTYITMLGYGYSWKELVFYAIAWTPKATVQAALSAAPLTLIQARIPPSNPEYADWIKWGNDILTTGIFTIIICGTIGLLAIHFTAPFLLLPSVKHEEEEGGQELEPQEVDRKASDSAVPVKASTASTDVAPPTGDRSVVGRHLRRPSAPHPGAPPEMRSEDYELVAEYIDAIRHLVVAAQAERPDKDEVQRLSNMVLHIQQRIETEVGRREPSVREMFRTASYLASQRPLSVNRQGQPHTATATPGAAAARGATTSRPHAPPTAQQSLHMQPRHPVLGLQAAAGQEPVSPSQPDGAGCGEERV